MSIIVLSDHLRSVFLMMFTYFTFHSGFGSFLSPRLPYFQHSPNHFHFHLLNSSNLLILTNQSRSAINPRLAPTEKKRTDYGALCTRGATDIFPGSTNEFVFIDISIINDTRKNQSDLQLIMQFNKLDLLTFKKNSSFFCQLQGFISKFVQIINLLFYMFNADNVLLYIRHHLTWVAHIRTNTIPSTFFLWFKYNKYSKTKTVVV